MRLCVLLIDDPSKLPTDPAKLKELVLAQDSHLRALAAGYERLQRLVYGHKSERLSREDQQEHDFFVDASMEAAPQPGTAVDDQANQGNAQTPSAAPGRKGHGRRPLPADLPRRRVEHDVPEDKKVCADCGCTKKRIGEEVTEQLDFVPATLQVIQHVCPRYACPHCQAGVVEGEKPFQPIAKGLAAPGLLSHVVVSKYADHLPLNRQQAIFARHGIDLSRSTLCDWVMQCADLASPVIEAMRRSVVQSFVIHSDDTGMPVLDADRTHRSFLWAYVGDDDHPYTVYDFTWTRSRAGPEGFLKDYEGYLQADAYSGYERLYSIRKIVEVACWAHARRKFFEAKTTDGVYAPEALKLIGRLYEVERLCQSLDHVQRHALRQERSLEPLNELWRWMEATAMKVLPKSPTGEAISYALNNRQALSRYLEDGRLDIDNNEAERALRAITVGRNNWMFAGNERGGRAAATFFTLIASAKRHGLNPFAYLSDLFERLPSHPVNRIAELLPDNWKHQQQACAA